MSLRSCPPLASALLSFAFTAFSVADDTVINTPVVTAQLSGVWELRPKDPKAFKQQLVLNGMFNGTWQQSENSLPVTIAWFVEGADLKILHYYEPNKPFNYRVKTLTYRYELDAKSLTLMRDEEKLVWKQIKRRPKPREEVDSGKD